MRSFHSHSGFTLIELLVVIAILGLLATMLMPAVTGAEDSARRSTDGNNLKQIMTMYKKHRADTRQTWAIPKALVTPGSGATATAYDGSAVTDASSAADVTYASFWELARRNDLAADLFNSPAGEDLLFRVAGLDDAADYTDKAVITADITSWLKDESGAAAEPAYMLDWSAPKNAGIIRPTLCNRGHENLFGGDHINVVFADTHLAGGDEFDLDGTGSVVHKALSGSGSSGTPDDILTSTGDEVGTGSTAVIKEYMLGRGHKRRAAMK